MNANALKALAALIAVELPPGRGAAFMEAVDDQVVRPLRGHPSAAEEARRLRVIELARRHNMAVYWTIDGRRGDGLPDWADQGLHWCWGQGSAAASSRRWVDLEKAVTEAIGGKAVA